MRPENKQRFSIRKYAIGAASVLIGFAFHAQAVAADGVVPTTTENLLSKPQENRLHRPAKKNLKLVLHQKP